MFSTQSGRYDLLSFQPTSVCLEGLGNRYHDTQNNGLSTILVSVTVLKIVMLSVVAPVKRFARE
jgi:hypothetical protein